MTNNNSLQLSAISQVLSQTDAKSSTAALPREILHNLEYQHKWTDLRLHRVVPKANPPILDLTNIPASVLPSRPDAIHLVSGLPPRHSYVHPDLLNHLVKHGLEEADIEVQREWVLPMSIGNTWTLRRFCQVFDALPARDKLEPTPGFKHQDVKRVLCGMKGNDGMGGDGTIVYYIMQEGEVKPRQN